MKVRRRQCQCLCIVLTVWLLGVCTGCSTTYTCTRHINKTFSVQAADRIEAGKIVAAPSVAKGDMIVAWLDGALKEAIVRRTGSPAEQRTANGAHYVLDAQVLQGTGAGEAGGPPGLIIQYTVKEQATNIVKCSLTVRRTGGSLKSRVYKSADDILRELYLQ